MRELDEALAGFSVELAGPVDESGAYPLRRSRYFLDGTQEQGPQWGRLPSVGFSGFNGRFIVETNEKNGVTLAVASSPLSLTGHDRSGKRIPKTEAGYRSYDVPFEFGIGARISVGDDEAMVVYSRTDKKLAFQRFTLEGEPLGPPSLAPFELVNAYYGNYDNEYGLPRKVGDTWYVFGIADWGLHLHAIRPSGAVTSRSFLWDARYDCMWRKDCGKSDTWVGGLGVNPIDIQGGPDGSVWVAFVDGSTFGEHAFRILKVDDTCVSRSDAQRQRDAAAASP